MSKISGGVNMLGCGLLASIFTCGVLLAQTAGDAFATWHEHLNDTADRTLATAIADRPWMAQAQKSQAPSIKAAEDSVGQLRAAVERVRQLRPTIEPILREEGVPGEISAIILVESGGLAAALSPKGARGLWQFIPDTARRYGLSIAAGHDERLDIEKSTHAAGRYLRDLYRQFGDWRLAFAAYNAGEQAVGQAINRSGRREFSAVQAHLPDETRRYVPAVIAAIARLQAPDARRPTHIIYASVAPGN